jgi:hypothetical protein
VGQRVLHGNSAVAEKQGHVVEKWHTEDITQITPHERMTQFLVATLGSWNCVLEDEVETHK